MRHQARARICLLGVTAAAAVAAGAVWQAVSAQTGAAAASADWHQWLGPNRNNISAETGWSTDWGEDGPKLLWRKNVGAGYSAVSVAKGLAYTMGNDGKSDTVWCFNADTGKKVWEKSYPCGKGDHPGPRCTPTVDGDVVYTLSYYGHLQCRDAKKGDVVWAKDLGKELGLRPSKWGFASSPLVDGDRLIVSAGAVLALNKKDGKVIWKTPKTKAGYSSPVLMTVGGKKCLAIFSGTLFQVLDAANGRQIGQMPWRTNYDVNAATPIVVGGGKVFITCGYGRGACALVQVTAEGLNTVWKNKNLKSQFTTGVLWKGHIYGVHGNVGRTRLVCIEPNGGTIKWSQAMGKMAALMLADGKLIVSTDPGGLIVCKAVPTGFEQLARANVGVRDVWTMPVLSGGRIFVRGYRGDLVCVSVKAK